MEELPTVGTLMTTGPRAALRVSSTHQRVP
jgi:hypothetical protein